MNQSIEDTLQSMKEPHVLEAAIMTLSPLLEVDDPEEGIDRLMALGELPAEEQPLLDSLIRQVSEEDARDALALMRAVMSNATETGLVERESMTNALDAVGRKQLVITADVYYLAVLLMAGYIVFVNKGRSSSSEKIVIEETKDGRKKITIEKKDIFLNPFSPLVELIQRLIKKPDAE